jgi:hypothetical protein
MPRWSIASGIVNMPEREPVHPRFRHACEPLSLFCQHWPSAEDAPTDTTHPDLTPVDRLRGKRNACRRFH